MRETNSCNEKMEERSFDARPDGTRNRASPNAIRDVDYIDSLSEDKQFETRPRRMDKMGKSKMRIHDSSIEMDIEFE